MKIDVIIHKADEGGYWAEVPALPGCVTQAENMSELKYCVNEAVEGWLKVHESKAIKKARKSGQVKIIHCKV